MNHSIKNLAAGTRVLHRGTREYGTVTATTADNLGVLATAGWDDREALELPHTLHAKHLASIPDDELLAEFRRRGLPETELAREATRLGTTPSALLERLNHAYELVMSR